MYNYKENTLLLVRASSVRSMQSKTPSWNFSIGMHWKIYSHSKSSPQDHFTTTYKCNIMWNILTYVGDCDKQTGSNRTECETTSVSFIEAAIKATAQLQQKKLNKSKTVLFVLFSFYLSSLHNCSKTNIKLFTASIAFSHTIPCIIPYHLGHCGLNFPGLMLRPANSILAHCTCPAGMGKKCGE